MFAQARSGSDVNRARAGRNTPIGPAPSSAGRRVHRQRLARSCARLYCHLSPRPAPKMIFHLGGRSLIRASLTGKSNLAAPPVRAKPAISRADRSAWLIGRNCVRTRMCEPAINGPLLAARILPDREGARKLYNGGELSEISMRCRSVRVPSKRICSARDNLIGVAVASRDNLFACERRRLRASNRLWPTGKPPARSARFGRLPAPLGATRARSDPRQSRSLVVAYQLD